MINHNLSFPKKMAKTTFERYFSSEKDNNAEWTKDVAGVAEKYLFLVHNIRVIPDFSKKLKEAHDEHHSSRKLSLSFYVLDSIVTSCDMWHEYLASQDDYNLLVCEEIFSMARIDTSVISGRNIQEVQGVSLKKPTPFSRVTIVKKNGALQLIR